MPVRRRLTVRAAGRRLRSQAGFTLVEILVVITIIGMIMALVGPRVLRLSRRVQGEGGEDPDRKLLQRARSLLSRPRALSQQQRRPRRAHPQQQRAGMERAIFARRRGAQRSLGAWLHLSLAGRARALRNHFPGLRRSGRRQWNGSRHCKQHALTSAGASRVSR